MYRLKQHCLAAGVALLPFLFPIAAKAATFSQVFVFGDSLSDTGNVYRRTLRLYPRSPYFRGRFSNGPVWAEYVTQQLEVERDRNNNFAYGGTTSGEGDTVPIPLLEFPGLQKQVRNFVDDNPTADPNALYLVWSGANDYLGGNVTDPRVPSSNLSKAVTTLAQAGARTIMVGNLPDLGRLPSTRQAAESAELDRLSRQHNVYLGRFLRRLDRTLDPQVNLLTLNVDRLFDQARANPAKLGFTNVTSSCLAVPSCRSTPSLQNQFLFWDDIHPTTAGHRQIAKLAMNLLAEPSREMQPQPRTAVADRATQDFTQPLQSENQAASASVPEPTPAAGLFTITMLAIGLRLRRRALRRVPSSNLMPR
ncbi:MAG: SGNH/GDSL hydrolase family protein [Leptolyngbyaceae cyanobacterium SM1_4_3]|nr:SGNH/GDSL hydrolase family protein [Leptolyngbyaceae cyanobacterium SM1_4_3]